MEVHPTLQTFMNQAPSFLPLYWHYHNDCCRSPVEKEFLVRKEDRYHFTKLTEYALKFFLIPFDKDLSPVQYNQQNLSPEYCERLVQREQKKAEERKVSFKVTEIIYFFSLWYANGRKANFTHSAFFFEDQSGKTLNVFFDPQNEWVDQENNNSFLRMVKILGPLNDKKCGLLLDDGPFENLKRTLTHIRYEEVGYFLLPSSQELLQKIRFVEEQVTFSKKAR